MDALSVFALAKQCVGAAPAIVVAALAIVETNGNPLAVQSERASASILTLEQAVQATSIALAGGDSPAIGIVRISVDALHERGLSIRQGLSACTNLKVAGELVAAHHASLSVRSDEDWRRAAIGYGTGNPDTGDVDSYGARYDAAHAAIAQAADEIEQIAGFDTTTQQASSQRPSSQRPSSTSLLAPHHVPEDPPASPVTRDAPSRGWDVYGRSSMLLRFSN